MGIVSIIAASVRKDAEVIEQPLKRDGYAAGVMRTYAHKVRKYAENSSQLADTPSDIPNIAGINSDVPS